MFRTYIQPKISNNDNSNVGPGKNHGQRQHGRDCRADENTWAIVNIGITQPAQVGSRIRHCVFKTVELHDVFYRARSSTEGTR
jgi:hypothetical protein